MIDKKNVTILSFYSKDTIYEKVISVLEKSCKQFNYKFKKVGFENTRNWDNNNNKKPKIIQEELKEINEDGVIWYLDSDCEIINEPDLTNVSSIHPSFTTSKIKQKADWGNKNKLNAGSMILPNTPITNKIVNDWVVTRPVFGDGTVVEQTVLEHLLVQYKGEFDVLDMRYNCKPKFLSKLKEEAFILHDCGVYKKNWESG